MDDLDFFADARSVRARPVPAQDTDPLTDHDAEVAILGACLMDAARFHEVAPLLRATDFDLPKHGTIWEAFRAVAARGEPVTDIPVMCAQLRTMTPGLVTVGGAQYLGELTDSIPSGAHVRKHVAIVADLAQRRRLRNLLLAGASRMNDLGRDTGLLLASIVHDLTHEGSRAARESTVCTAREAVKAALKQREATIERRAQNKDAWVGVPQPLGSLRRVMGGWMPKQMTVLSAGTSVGKTAFALQAAAVDELLDTGNATNEALAAVTGAVIDLPDDAATEQPEPTSRIAAAVERAETPEQLARKAEVAARAANGSR